MVMDSMACTMDIIFLSYQYMKILNVCLSMCNGSGKFRGWDYSSDARPSYLLYFVLHVHDNEQTHLRSSS